jgi:hypothetical protein
MKSSILITTAIAALGLLGTTPSAEARPHHRHSSSHVYISGYRSCGTPVYKEKYLIGYDRCGYPVWGYRIVSPPVRYCPPPRDYYYSRPAVCPPPNPYYYGNRPRNGVVISGAFRL